MYKITSFSLSLYLMLFFYNCGYSQIANSYKIFSDPYDIHLLNDSTLVLHDYSNEDMHICLYLISIEEYGTCIVNGNGPGEVSGNLTRISVNYENEEIYVWDGGNYRFSLYDNELKFIENISLPKIEDHNFSKPSYRIPLGDNDEFLINTYKRGIFGKYYTASENKLTTLNIYDDLIDPVKKNPLLLQGKYAIDWKSNSLILTSDHSSFMVKISNSSVDYLTLGEPNIPFPKNKNEYDLALPEVSTYTHSTIDISISNNLIYVLHSGKKPKKREVLWYAVRARFEELIQKLESSNTILVYDLETGAFIEKIILEDEVYLAKVFNGSLYTLKRGKEDTLLEIRELE